MLVNKINCSSAWCRTWCELGILMLVPGRKPRRRVRDRGRIETLPSGALRVVLYAGVDPVTGRRHYLRKVIPAGTPNAAAEAEATLTAFVNQVNERLHPRTRSTVNQLLDKYFATVDVAAITRQTHVSYAAKHVRPFIGEQQAGAIDADVLDSLYAELRRCRDHCDGRRRVTKHRIDGKHRCDERCRRHVCAPLAPATIRKIHFIISGAYSAGIRWRWVSRNPAGDAAPPAAPPSNPSPPTAAEAASILETAWADPDWGSHVWLAMTTGARRGELCAVRWRDVDLQKGLLRLYGSKTGKDRRVALDPTSVAVLGEQRQRYENRAAQLGSLPREDAFVFSKLPDHSAPLDPRSVTQRYKRMVTKLGIDSHLHTLRHYSATELIAGGVDVRTVAGRLGHADATTTLKVYAAWLSEADQRASQSLFARLPARPVVVTAAPRHPHERIAAEIRTEIIAGTYAPASLLPTVKEIAATHNVSVGTAHRAIENLSNWGFVAVRRGVRATVTPRESWPPIESSSEGIPAIKQQASESTDDKKRLYEFRLRRADESIWKFTAPADISSVDDLRRILARAVQRTSTIAHAADFELDVYEIGGDMVTTFIDFAV